jgi:hypothetical protein
MRSIYNAPLSVNPRIDTLILGAFGCGAFSPDTGALHRHTYVIELAWRLFHTIQTHPLRDPTYETVCIAIPAGWIYDTCLGIFKSALAGWASAVKLDLREVH